MSAADLCSRFSIVNYDLRRLSINNTSLVRILIRVILISLLFPLTLLVDLDIDFSDSSLFRNIDLREISGLTHDMSKETNALF